MKFQDILVDLGTLKPASRVVFVFPYTKEENERIVEIVPSCGCGDIKDDKKISAIKVEYVTKPVPIQLTARGKTSYKAKKSLVIHYDSGEGTPILTIKLEFKAIVKI